MRLPTPLLRPLALAGGVLLCLGAAPDSTREVLPAASPRFAPPDTLLFADEFLSGRLDRWRADRTGVWSVRRGMLRAGLPDGRQDHSFLYAGDSTWTDYAVDLDVCGMRGVDKGLVVRVRGSRGLGVDLRGSGYHDVKLHLNEMPVTRVSIENGNTVWHHLRVEIRGRRCRVVVNGREVVNRKISSRLPGRGSIALAAYTGGAGECTVYYDNVVVTPLEAASRAVGGALP